MPEHHCKYGIKKREIDINPLFEKLTSGSYFFFSIYIGYRFSLQALSRSLNTKDGFEDMLHILCNSTIPDIILVP